MDVKITMAKFTVFFNGECINTYEMDEPVISIGRLPENAISIANMGVSRRHVKIEEDADRKYILTDLNSLNGTYVNGKRIKKINLTHGDKITIGKYTILYEESDPQGNSDQLPMENYSVPENENVRVSESIGSPEITLSQGEGEPEKVQFFADESVPNNGRIAEESDTYDQNVFLTNESTLKDVIDHKPDFNEAVLIETNKHVVYKLDKNFITMGSGDNDDIFVSGFLISEGQVSIEKHDENGFELCANKFIGKVKINGKSAKTHLLKHKDRIEIGSSTFRYMENG